MKQSDYSLREDLTGAASETTSSDTSEVPLDIFFHMGKIYNLLRVQLEALKSATAALQTSLPLVKSQSGKPHIESCLRSLYSLEASIGRSMEECTTAVGWLASLNQTEPSSDTSTQETRT